MNRFLGNRLVPKPVLDVSAAEFRAGQSQAFTTDQSNALGFYLTNVAGRSFIAVAHRLRFFCVPERDVGDLMEQCPVRREGDRRDGHLPERGIPLAVAVEM